MRVTRGITVHCCLTRLWAPSAVGERWPVAELLAACLLATAAPVAIWLAISSPSTLGTFRNGRGLRFCRTVHPQQWSHGPWKSTKGHCSLQCILAAKCACRVTASRRVMVCLPKQQQLLSGWLVDDQHPWHTQEASQEYNKSRGSEARQHLQPPQLFDPEGANLVQIF